MVATWKLVAFSCVPFSLAAAFLYAFDVQLHPIQVTVIALLFIVSMVFILVTKVLGINLPSLFKSEKSTEMGMMKKALRIAKDFWLQEFSEELVSRDGQGTRRPYSGGLAWGFVLHRVASNIDNAGLPAVVIVGYDSKSGPKGMDVLDWIEKPNSREQANPFHNFSAGYSGSPFTGMSPSDDASFSGSRWGGYGARTDISITPGGSSDDFFTRKKPQDGK